MSTTEPVDRTQYFIGVYVGGFIALLTTFACLWFGASRNTALGIGGLTLVVAAFFVATKLASFSPNLARILMIGYPVVAVLALSVQDPPSNVGKPVSQAPPIAPEELVKAKAELEKTKSQNAASVRKNEERITELNVEIAALEGLAQGTEQEKDKKLKELLEVVKEFPLILQERSEYERELRARLSLQKKLTVVYLGEIAKLEKENADLREAYENLRKQHEEKTGINVENKVPVGEKSKVPLWIQMVVPVLGPLIGDFLTETEYETEVMPLFELIKQGEDLDENQLLAAISKASTIDEKIELLNALSNFAEASGNEAAKTKIDNLKMTAIKDEYGTKHLSDRLKAVFKELNKETPSDDYATILKAQLGDKYQDAGEQDEVERMLIEFFPDIKEAAWAVFGKPALVPEVK